MGGSKPEWADANDHATLEEVFASRSFGHPLPKAPRRAGVPQQISASKLYFARNRFIASGAVAAAALSVVAGLSIGSGPIAQQVLSARGPVVPGTVSTPTTVPGPAADAPGNPGSAVTAGTGTQPPSSVEAPVADTVSSVTGVVASSSTPQGGGTTPTAILAVVGSGPTVPAASGSGTSTTTTHDDDDHIDHDSHIDVHHDDHSRLVGLRRRRPGRWREHEQFGEQRRGWHEYGHDRQHRQHRQRGRLG